MRHVILRTLGFLGLPAVMVLSPAVGAEGVQWHRNPQTALEQASTTDRPLLIKFTAEWCGYCKKMERTTFADPATIKIVHRSFVPLLIDADKHGDLIRHLKVRGLPAILIIAPDTTVLERITGYQTSQELVPKLNAVTATHNRTLRVPALPAAQARTTTVPSDQNPVVDSQIEPQQPSVSGSEQAAKTSVTRRGPEVQDAGHGVTPVAFDGLCLTSVVEKRTLVTGSDAFAGKYRGQILHFGDETRRTQFFQSPDKYWPMLDGICAVTLLKTGEQVTGHFRHAAVYRDRIWLFENREHLKEFIDSPADHVAKIEKHRSQMSSADGT